MQQIIYGLIRIFVLVEKERTTIPWQVKTACLSGYIRATSWENLLMPYANNKGADQPAHPHSLISAFVFTAWIV